MAAPSQWLSDDQWAVLHAQIRPNTRTVAEFKELALGGQLSIYSRNHMDAVLRQLKMFLRSHGRLADADAASQRARLTKPELAVMMAEIFATGSVPRAAPVEAARPPSGDELLQGAPVQPPAAPVPLPPPRRTIMRSGAVSSSPPAVSAPVMAASGRTSILNAGDVARDRLEDDHPPPAATPQGDGGRRNEEGEALLAAITRLRPAGPVPPRPLPKTQFGKFESPLLQIVHCIQRVPVRMGAMRKSIIIPPEHLADIADRRLRLVLFPVDGVNFTPSAWPALRDVTVTFNKRATSNTFRRTWPNRRHEMHKSYLTLDVTTLVNRDSAQYLSVDCGSRDYYSQLVVAVARPHTEAEAAAEIRARCERPDAYQGFQARKALYELYRRNIEESFGGGDDDVMVDTCASTVSVKCPVTQMRVGTPARGIACKHMQCFDLEGALRNCHTACYWSCPICDMPITSTDLIVDPHLAVALAAAAPSVRAIRHVPTVANPTQWMTAEEEADEPSDGNRSPVMRDSLGSLLVSSDDDDAGVAAQPRRSGTGLRAAPSGTSNDPISID